jgi:hypothetical protein
MRRDVSESVVALQVLLHVIVSWHVGFWKGVSTESYNLKTNCFEWQRMCVVVNQMSEGNLVNVNRLDPDDWPVRFLQAISARICGTK